MWRLRKTSITLLQCLVKLWIQLVQSWFSLSSFLYPWHSPWLKFTVSLPFLTAPNRCSLESQQRVQSLLGWAMAWDENGHHPAHRAGQGMPCTALKSYQATCSAMLQDEQGNWRNTSSFSWPKTSHRDQPRLDLAGWLSLPFLGTAGRKMFGFFLMNKHRRIDQMQGSTMLQLKYAHTDPFLLPQHRHSFTHQQPKTISFVHPNWSSLLIRALSCSKISFVSSKCGLIHCPSPMTCEN